MLIKISPTPDVITLLNAPKNRKLFFAKEPPEKTPVRRDFLLEGWLYRDMVIFIEAGVKEIKFID